MSGRLRAALAADFAERSMRPGLLLLAAVGGPRSSPAAQVGMLAIAGQESEWIWRVQKGNGPARGFWQFERLAVLDVLTRATTRRYAAAVCRELGISADAAGLNVHPQLAANDRLAAAFARLNLFTDPHPLPAADDRDGWWAYYERVWKPGEPRPRDWPAVWAAASAVPTLALNFNDRKGTWEWTR